MFSPPKSKTMVLNMTLTSPYLLFFFTCLCLTIVAGSNDDTSVFPAGYSMPSFPNESFINSMRLKLQDQSLCNGKLKINSGPDKIPHHLWIAVKDNASSYLEWPNIKDEIALNPTWSIHVCDNTDKDSFMEQFFEGTSLLWSYKNINPVIAGASKADIWRYAMLYVYGGVYIDSDSQLRKPLSEVIKPSDEMVVACENNHFDGDWCYSPNSEFATLNTIKKHPQVAATNLFKG
jgi:hypothetical protein